MENMDFAFATKALTADGVVEGIAAGFGNVDEGGDMILPGAFAEALPADGKARIPMLMYHDDRRPAGVWTELRETDDGLQVKGRFALSTRQGKEAYALVKEGALSGLSIGYRSLKDSVKDGVRLLEKLRLFEVSLVTVPMNERAVVTGVKGLLEDGQLPTLRQFERHLREAGFSKTQAVAVANKGLAALLRGEPDKADDGAAFLAALQAEVSA